MGFQGVFGPIRSRFGRGKVRGKGQRSGSEAEGSDESFQALLCDPVHSSLTPLFNTLCRRRTSRRTSVPHVRVRKRKVVLGLNVLLMTRAVDPVSIRGGASRTSYSVYKRKQKLQKAREESTQFVVTNTALYLVLHRTMVSLVPI